VEQHRVLSRRHGPGRRQVRLPVLLLDCRCHNGRCYQLLLAVSAATSHALSVADAATVSTTLQYTSVVACMRICFQRVLLGLCMLTLLCFIYIALQVFHLSGLPSAAAPDGHRAVQADGGPGQGNLAHQCVWLLCAGAAHPAGRLCTQEARHCEWSWQPSSAVQRGCRNCALYDGMHCRRLNELLLCMARHTG
jgi:hypothetical protein